MSDDRREFDVLPAGEMQRKYGLYAEDYRPSRIDRADVPTHLHDLIPWAERFGVSCDITRHDVGEKTPQKDKDALSEALRGRHAQINEWLNSSLPLDGSVSQPTDAENAFLCMCVFELEENGGPGLAGPPEWYMQKLKERNRQATRERFIRESNGPLCPSCGKPLRTPKAKRCFVCGASWHEQ